MCASQTPLPTDRPIAGVLAAVIRDNKVLLVRRANRPDAGRWVFPGGKVEKGEPLLDAAMRELREETGVLGKGLKILSAVDAFDKNADGEVEQHFILIVTLCQYLGGSLKAGDDAVDARWVELDQLRTLDLARSFDLAELVRQAAQMMGKPQR
ncbi:ADP-ribose pyrophosphatase YjhB, NUDIX family [Cohaesibacter sp. ES.047]|uniref:NUDIX hydrolase n=1 Tax=Cohaesibacter sp. ES.047 TaxID=1798205 RepID=UPI000BB8A352|nr:NUDIX hydrolase [Cohaesibacter sp. ES.047]SNY93141.1 ADP-ribose pyrophosphatase YjhB, NUDIX family [Cohaesibacter sp. ES.047]